MGLLYKPTPLQYALIMAKNDILKAKYTLHNHAVGSNALPKMHRQLKMDYNSLTATVERAFAEVDAMVELYLYQEQDNREKILRGRIYGEIK
jgi:hypothetical protein